MTLRTITVAELIDRLRDEAPDARVVFAADYGDRCHTEQALAVRGEIEEVSIEESGYSSSGFAIVDAEYDTRRRSVVPGTYVVIR